MIKNRLFILAAAGMMAIALGGGLIAAPVVDENIDPGKAPPLATSTKPVAPVSAVASQHKGSGDAPAAGTAAAASAQGAGDSEYVVKPGDYLIKIAQELLGDGNRYMEIVEANRDVYPSLMKNPSLIHPGWKLKIPGGAANNASSGPSESAPISGTIQVGTYLNVRSGPWGSIVGKLNQGDKVEIIGTQGDWYKIKFNGQTAYVHQNYVNTPNKQAGSTPVNQPGSSNPDPTITPGNGRFGAAPCSPMPGRTSSEYGPRDLFGHSFHSGIDLPVGNGTRLNALGDGVVTASGFESGGGTFVKIRYDNGVESFYCHLQKSEVRTGQRVSMGQEVARSDNTGQWTTGAHLHMGIKVNGSYVNPRSVSGIPLPPK